VFLIDLPLLPEASRSPSTYFQQELIRFLSAMGLDDNLVGSLQKYDFSRTKNYGFIHSM
jgi:hypothetical protein